MLNMLQIENGGQEDSTWLPASDLHSIHHLAMGYVLSAKGKRKQRVLERGSDRRYRFVLLDDSGEMPANDSGAVDTYLGVRVAKLSARTWSMRISFLENVMSVASRDTNSRTIYDMEWNTKNGIGMKWQVESIANAAMNTSTEAHASHRTLAEVLNSGNAVRTPELTLEWMNLSDLDYIANRMLTVAAHVVHGRRVA